MMTRRFQDVVWIARARRQHDIAWRFGIDKQVLDPRASGSAQLGNWLRARVLPPRAERAVAA